jgi:hypothetical protein
VPGTGITGRGAGQAIRASAVSVNSSTDRGLKSGRNGW